MEEIIDLLRVVKLCQLQDEILDLDASTLFVRDVGKNVKDCLPRGRDDRLEHVFQIGDRLSDALGDLIVLVPELDFLKD